MKVHLQYGRNGLDVELPFSQINVLQPKFIPGLADEQEEFKKSCRKPIDSLPLKDLIIAEELLPFKNGPEIIRKANEKQIPTIIISDADLEIKILEAFELGAVDFIDKPFSPNELVARAKNALNKRKRSS